MTMDKLFDGSDAHLLPGNAELIANLRGENLECNCCAYSRSECCCNTCWPESFCNKAADALEAADKRIAELEAELQKRAKQIGVACMTHDLTHSLACGRCLTEAERNLAVAREALKEVIAWSQLRTIENVSAEPDLFGECIPKTDAASYCLSPASQDV